MSFDISKFVGGFISPKIGLALIRNRLQAEINAAFKAKNPSHVDLIIKDYRMIIICATDSVSFVISGEPIPYAHGAELAKVVKQLVTAKVKEGDSLDAIVIDYKTDGETAITVGYKIDGEKLQKKIIL